MRPISLLILTTVAWNYHVPRALSQQDLVCKLDSFGNRSRDTVSFKVERSSETEELLAVIRSGNELYLRAGSILFTLKVQMKEEGWFLRMGFDGANTGGQLSADSMSICDVGKDGLFDSIQVAANSSIRLGDQLVNVVNKRGIPDSGAFRMEPTRIQSYWVQAGRWGSAIEQGFGSASSKLEFNHRDLFRPTHPVEPRFLIKLPDQRPIKDIDDAVSKIRWTKVEDHRYSASYPSTFLKLPNGNCRITFKTFENIECGFEVRADDQIAQWGVRGVCKQKFLYNADGVPMGSVFHIGAYEYHDANSNHSFESIHNLVTDEWAIIDKPNSDDAKLVKVARPIELEFPVTFLGESEPTKYRLEGSNWVRIEQ